MEERLHQWSEYEGTFDRLLTWLSETETSLKDYLPRSTLEQKEEQLERYQVIDTFYLMNVIVTEDSLLLYKKKCFNSCTFTYTN